MENLTELLANYIKTLEKFDWWTDYSDDHSVYERGREAYAELQKVRKLIDVDYQVWNSIVPKDFRVEPK